MNLWNAVRWAAIFAAMVVTVPSAGMAFQTGGSISGTVTDPLGATVAGTVRLYRYGAEIAQTTSSVAGEYSFTGLDSGRYQVEAAAEGFASSMSDAIFVGSTGNVTVNVSVQIGPLMQQITVTAAAAELPVAQIGAPVSIIDQDLIERLGKPDILETLRTVPGLSVVPDRCAWWYDFGVHSWR